MHTPDAAMDAALEAAGGRAPVAIECEADCERSFVERFEVDLSDLDIERGAGKQAQRSIALLLPALAPGETFSLRYAGGQGQPLRMGATCMVRAETPGAAGARASAMRQAFNWALACSTRSEHLQAEHEAGPARGAEQRCASAAATALWLPRRVEAGFCSNAVDAHDGAWLLLDAPHAVPGSHLGLAALLRYAPTGTTVQLALEPFRLSPAQRSIIDEATGCAESGRGPFRDRRLRDLTNPVVECLGGWARAGGGLRCSLSVYGAVPLPDTLLDIVAAQFFGVPVAASGDLAPARTPPIAAALDLRRCVPFAGGLPPLFHDPADASDQRRPPSMQMPAALPGTGVVLGVAGAGGLNREVRLDQADRGRHCYIVGSTGSGKSTLMANMALQDIAQGKGVCVIDPHGDLIVDLMHRLPASRANDLVLLDATRDDRVFALNPLACGASEADRHRAIDDLLATFHRLFDRETMGPVFEVYLRNTLLLLVHSWRAAEATLLDVPAVFENAGFRKSMLLSCTSEPVRQFWTQTAERTSGEYHLANLAAYVVSKFNRFVFNPPVRRIIGQTVDSFDFREAMDRGKVVLVNLSKGALGDSNTRLLGMLLTAGLLRAAWSRAALPPAKRRPFYLYLDEAGHLATESLAQGMGEARKYGLHLTLANQNLQQLQNRLSDLNITEAVLCNAGNILSFRAGPPDAALLARYTEPEIAARDLHYLPDHHVAARLLAGGMPLPAFVMRTMPLHPPPPFRAGTRALRRALDRHTRPIAEVDAALLRRERSRERPAAGSAEL